MGIDPLYTGNLESLLVCCVSSGSALFYMKGLKYTFKSTCDPLKQIKDTPILCT